MRGCSRRVIERKRWVVDYGLPAESAMDEDASLIETVSPLIQSPAKDLPQDTQKDASSGKNEEVLINCKGIGQHQQEEIQMEE